MEHLDQLTSKQQHDIQVYCNGHRHMIKPTTADITLFTVDLMEKVGNSPLTSKQKKELVTALYMDVAKDDTNGFDTQDNISDLIDLADRKSVV